MNAIEVFEKAQVRNQFPRFNVGDTVRVSLLITEGDKQRTQVFEGVVIGTNKGEGARGSVTVRKISYGVGVEKVFPLHSPGVQDIQVVRRGRVRRAKLYYLRQLRGKAARIKEAKYNPDEAKKSATPKRQKKKPPKSVQKKA